MGIPGFVRWLSQQFDVLHAVPDDYCCDCLYLDLNGALHVTSHNNNVMNRPSNDEIFQATEQWIRNIVNIVNPTMRLCVAFDGVAPRAKMNQQRARRFSKARDSQALHEKIVQRIELWNRLGLEGPEEAPPLFDANKITPGTEFMQAANRFLHEFAGRFAKETGLELLVSDSSSPGEGEHKIMDWLRESHNDLVHVVVGNDSDLYLLCAVLPLDDIFLLRRNQDKKNALWNLVNIQRFRRQLLAKMGKALLTLDENPLDHVNMLHDFVFLSSLCGNDFLPALPHLTLHNNHWALEDITSCYEKMYSETGEFITSGLTINYKALHTVFDLLGQDEDYTMRKISKQHRANNKRFNDRKHKRKRQHAQQFKDNKKIAKKNLDVPGQTMRCKTVYGEGEVVCKREDGMVEVKLAFGTAFMLSQNVTFEEMESDKEASEQKEESEGPAHQPHRLDTLTHQIEYYMSNKNLSRDRLLVAVLRVNEGRKVPLFCFMTFPKVMEMTDKIDELREAISRSSLLGVEDDFVFRKDGVHVDNLPELPRTKHNWVSEIQFLEKSMSKVNLKDAMFRFQAGSPNWQEKWHKYKTLANTEESVMQLCEDFLRGMVWVLDYYLHGIRDWNWFYGNHYAPTMLDLHCFQANSQFEIEPSDPVKPSIQLLTVLPEQSCSHVAPCFRSIYSHARMRKFYPTDFKVDYNGCGKAFQAKVLLPFLEPRTLEEVAKSLDLRTEEEKKRDEESKVLVYSVDGVTEYVPASEKAQRRRKLIFGGLAVAALVGLVVIMRRKQRV